MSCHKWPRLTCCGDDHLDNLWRKKEEELLIFVYQHDRGVKETVAFNHISQRSQWFHPGSESHNPTTEYMQTYQKSCCCLQVLRNGTYRTKDLNRLTWELCYLLWVLNSVHCLEGIEIRTAKVNWGLAWEPVQFAKRILWTPLSFYFYSLVGAIFPHK